MGKQTNSHTPEICSQGDGTVETGLEISAGMPTALPEGEEEIPLLSTKWELSDGMKFLDLSNVSQDAETVRA